jgi:hypothetical protein
LAKQYRGEDLSPSEAETFAVHPLVARDLLQRIPRLEGVAEIVGYQEKHFDGEGTPPDGPQGKAIPVGSLVLKVALDFDALVSSGSAPEMAVAHLRHRPGWYDPDVLAALCQAMDVRQAYAIRAVRLDQLQDGMVLAADVRSLQGTLLCAKGHEVTPATRVRLRNYVCNLGLRGSIEVFAPVGCTGEEIGLAEQAKGPAAADWVTDRA